MAICCDAISGARSGAVDIRPAVAAPVIVGDIKRAVLGKCKACGGIADYGIAMSRQQVRLDVHPGHAVVDAILAEH